MFVKGPLEALNAPQLAAVRHGDGPLLVLAGAGSGKTRTLTARVARLLADGVAPERILLLTFTRRAAAEMLRRVAAAAGPTAGASRVWGGTFHAVGNRLLRLHGQAIGLRPDFSVVDAGDAADLLDLVRSDLGVAEGAKRFPRATTLAAIYSRTVNAREPVSEVVDRSYPWCRDATDGIIAVFRAYTERKRERQVLDYDDLLLWWWALLGVPGVGEQVSDAFDHVLVDEYQDTNALQADILTRLRATNANLTVVGDDAQAIYSFRAATVENILRFGEQFPGATIVRLEQNYRSTQPILDAANAVMAGAPRRWEKRLWSDRPDRGRPVLASCRDEAEQSERVCDAVLACREQGTPLREQAVLFRAGHHSDHLEVELSRRGIPFVKYGGLKFLEAAHVKDLLALLRLLDNPGDELAWFRALQLLQGVGPATARRVFAALQDGAPDAAISQLLDDPPPVPAAAAEDFAAFRSAVADCAGAGAAQGPGWVASQVERLRRFYEPVCRRVHDDAATRLRDLEQLELVAAGYTSRSAFVADLVLDPPSATSDLACPPLLDEDYLILSTIHSAKGLEWHTVAVLHAADGMIPSDMACGSVEEIEEERRLLYVALTRAREQLTLYAPLRYYHQRYRPRDTHGYSQVSRFLTGPARTAFDLTGPTAPDPEPPRLTHTPTAVGDVLAALWH